MRLVLTGASGYLGGRLALRLGRLGHEVLAIIRSGTDPAHHRRATGGAAAVLIDDRDIVERISGADAVIHLACSYGRAGESSADLVDANVTYALRILDLAGSAKIARFLNAGTSLPSILGGYALAKSQFVEWTRSRASGPAFIQMRLEHFYGPKDSTSKFTSRVISDCLAGRPVTLTAGMQIRDFLYIDDAVESFVTVVGTPLPSDRWTEYPVGSGTGITVRHYVETVHRLTNSLSDLRFGEVAYRAGEPMRSVADISALAALGWIPTISLEDGLLATIEAERETK